MTANNRTKAQIIAKFREDLDGWARTRAMWSYEIDRAPDFRSKEARRIAYERIALRLQVTEVLAYGSFPEGEVTKIIIDALHRFRANVANGIYGSIFDAKAGVDPTQPNPYISRELREVDERLERYAKG